MVVIHGETERRKTADLVPYARNSRTHSDEQIAQIREAMLEWGFTNPVVIDSDGGIVAGHGRVMAALGLGMLEVPVVVVSGWSEAQKRAYVIADNKLALNAGWDEKRLASEMADLQVLGFNFDAMGFDVAEVGEIVSPKVRKGKTADDSAPAVPKVALSRLGDVWNCGPHRVMCGDSTDPASVALLLGGVRVDLLLTDPPYNVSYAGKTPEAMKIQNDSMGAAAFRAFLGAALAEAVRHMKPGAVFYIWHADLEGLNFRGACADVGLRIQAGLVWKKHYMVIGRQDYHWQHEPCLYGWKDGADRLWLGDGPQGSILRFDKVARNGEHPTMKSVALFEYQLQNSSAEGEIVLDLFGGSGTTLIAAEKFDRVARLMELEPVYADVIVSRWQAWTESEARLASTGQTWAEVRAERLAGAALEVIA